MRDEMTMSEQRTTPAPVRGLRLLQGDTAGGDTAPDTGGDTQGDIKPGTAPIPVSVPGAEVVPLSPAERTRLAAAHWAGIAANGAGQLWLHPGRVVYVLWHGKPESMAEHRAYVKSREWVPEELRGHRPGGFIAAAGIVYHLAIARPVKAAARIVDAAAERPLRLLMLAVLVFALVFIL
jgi:hypothetical protein